MLFPGFFSLRPEQIPANVHQSHRTSAVMTSSEPAPAYHRVIGQAHTNHTSARSSGGASNDLFTFLHEVQAYILHTAN